MKYFHFLYPGHFIQLLLMWKRGFNGALLGMNQFGLRKPVKNDEKYFLIHLKSYFLSQNI